MCDGLPGHVSPHTLALCVTQTTSTHMQEETHAPFVLTMAQTNTPRPARSHPSVSDSACIRRALGPLLLLLQSSSVLLLFLPVASLGPALIRGASATRLVSPGSGGSVAPACDAAAQGSEMSIGSFQRHHRGSLQGGGAGETAEMKRSWNYYGYSIPTTVGELKHRVSTSL